jgi:hypothetical protein
MKNWIISILLLQFCTVSFGQTFPEGIAYQAQIFDEDGGYLAEETVGIRFNIRANAILGSIVWQEDHLVTLSDIGHFNLVVGQGVSSGVGSAGSFEEIDWSSGVYFLELLADKTMSGSYNSILTQQMVAVPFAFHAKTTDQKFAMSELLDVDTTGIQIGDVLKWDGVAWVPAIDDVADTVEFAIESGFSFYADTANYAFNCENPVLVDSATYAYFADSVNYANEAYHSLFTDSTNFADTAGVALFAINNWGIEGNDNIDETLHFLGTIDSVDLVLKAFNEERMRIKANGKIGIGTTEPIADFQIENGNGVVFTGTHGEGVIPAEGMGNRMMWYPKKSAFRAGYVTGNRWDDAFIGNYSFAAGYNTRATQDYAVAFGFSSSASNEGSFAAGNLAVASGLYSFAVGHNPTASGDFSVAIGRGANATHEGALALGYHPTASGDYGVALGNYVTASGENSVAIGYRSRALHDGSFIWSDFSDPGSFLETTATNQFMIRASGGSIFYSSSDLSTGVVLAPGAGAWSILSDRNKKDNIMEVDLDEYLKKLDGIEVYEWNYKSQVKTIRHVGPMAQDFYQAFDLGSDDKTINSGDFDGVNLVLLKALNEKMNALELKEAELIQLNTKFEELEKKRLALFQLLEKLQKQVNEQESKTALLN